MDDQVQSQRFEAFHVLVVHGHAGDGAIIFIHVGFMNLFDGFNVGVLRGHRQHDHVDLVTVVDSFPEIDICRVTFDDVVTALLEVADARRIMLDAEHLSAVDLRELFITSKAYPPNAEDQGMRIAQIDWPVIGVDLVWRASR